MTAAALTAGQFQVRLTVGSFQPASMDRDIVAPPSASAQRLIESVLELTILEQDWDQAGGVAVSIDAARASMQTIIEAASVGLTPNFVPLGDGALLAEFYRGNHVLHIEWSAEGDADFDYSINGVLQNEGPLPAFPRELIAWFAAAM